ncbi:flagellar motor switch protein FliN [Kushneria marisflavi]|uniref:Flagellar motor switch protein FliN n=1 Tax=Kushneria marisflavi TaxID=157779 RepID=A0A240UTT2_9GAMM|nr:flagellar motor switch protein FliN [Kushneria marisflavi]ART64439.1 flagellar motor switch protein FliN [Kushneria marisflavi]RKD86593.1 flagellar motor switch protein FliN/FliY [Kushneria marisflavi]
MTDPKNPDSLNDKPDEMPDDWASAMQEQGASTDEDDIDWGAAFAETGETPEHSVEESSVGASAEPASDRIFQPLSGSGAHGQSRELDVIMEIPVTLSVELGRTRMTIRELLDLAKGSVVELDGLAGEPMNILINGYLIAQGEVVVVEDKYGIRITDIITPSERIHKLNR